MVTILLPQSKQSAPPSVDDPARGLMESFQRITIVGWVACGHPIDIFSQEERLTSPQNWSEKTPMRCVSAVTP